MGVPTTRHSAWEGSSGKRSVGHTRSGILIAFVALAFLFVSPNCFVPRSGSFGLGRLTAAVTSAEQSSAHARFEIGMQAVEGEVGASENVEPQREVIPSILNAVGGPLEQCSTDPLTGWFRDGYCRTDESDLGRHLVCVETTAEFLEYQRKIGNDLSTPAPMYGFPGLVPGNSWCVCASRWAEAVIGGVTAPLRAKASHAKALDFAPEETILRNAIDVA
mmetsp:Transcript_29939/g.78926  ORF Transcript_29939/g.78926 Transcript_29939/m.78926 type:complete len:219 (-) Transcript_29939:60-716(-)